LFTIIVAFPMPHIISAWHNGPKSLRGYVSKVESTLDVEDQERGRPMSRAVSSRRSEMMYKSRQGSEPGSCRAGGKTPEISAPMMAENSLGWN
jgi:hypothetical protein